MSGKEKQKKKDKREKGKEKLGLICKATGPSPVEAHGLEMQVSGQTGRAYLGYLVSHLPGATYQYTDI